MNEKQAKSFPVSANNPCPFLRGLVAEGTLSDDIEPCARIAEAVVKKSERGAGAPKLGKFVIYLIALISNGLNPLTIIRTKFKGVRLNELRSGPLYKKGCDSGVIDQHGKVSAQELERLNGFASEKRTINGAAELGLDAEELRVFMKANLDRADKPNRFIHRKMMEGEWPVLLKVMGQDGPDGRYLSTEDIHRLIVHKKFPNRMNN